jgi:hypothetical protein
MASIETPKQKCQGFPDLFMLSHPAGEHNKPEHNFANRNLIKEDGTFVNYNGRPTRECDSWTDFLTTYGNEGEYKLFESIGGMLVKIFFHNDTWHMTSNKLIPLQNNIASYDFKTNSFVIMTNLLKKLYDITVGELLNSLDTNYTYHILMASPMLSGCHPDCMPGLVHTATWNNSTHTNVFPMNAENAMPYIDNILTRQIDVNDEFNSTFERNTHIIAYFNHGTVKIHNQNYNLEPCSVDDIYINDNYLKYYIFIRNTLPNNQLIPEIEFLIKEATQEIIEAVINSETIKNLRPEVLEQVSKFLNPDYYMPEHDDEYVFRNLHPISKFNVIKRYIRQEIE